MDLRQRVLTRYQEEAKTASGPPPLGNDEPPGGDPGTNPVMAASGLPGGDSGGPGKRNIPKDHPYDPRALKPLSRMLWAMSVALGHGLTAYRQFAKLKSSTISPDGMLGGRGYVMQVKEIRDKLHDACENLSSISDTIHDEINAPHWEPKMNQLDPNDALDVRKFIQESQQNLQNPEEEAEDEMEAIQDSAQQGAGAPGEEGTEPGAEEGDEAAPGAEDGVETPAVDPDHEQAFLKDQEGGDEEAAPEGEEDDDEEDVEGLPAKGDEDEEAPPADEEGTPVDEDENKEEKQPDEDEEESYSREDDEDESEGDDTSDDEEEDPTLEDGEDTETAPSGDEETAPVPKPPGDEEDKEDEDKEDEDKEDEDKESPDEDNEESPDEDESYSRQDDDEDEDAEEGDDEEEDDDDEDDDSIKITPEDAALADKAWDASSLPGGEEPKPTQPLKPVKPPKKKKKKMRREDMPPASMVQDQKFAPDQSQQRTASAHTYDRSGSVPATDPSILPGPRVDHIDRGEGEGPGGSYNEDEPRIDGWSLNDGRPPADDGDLINRLADDNSVETWWDGLPVEDKTLTATSLQLQTADRSRWGAEDWEKVFVHRESASAVPDHITDDTGTDAWDFGIGYGAHGDGAGGYENPSGEGDGDKGVLGPTSGLPKDSTDVMPTDVEPPVARSDYYDGGLTDEDIFAQAELPSEPQHPQPPSNYYFSQSELPDSPNIPYTYDRDVMRGDETSEQLNTPYAEKPRSPAES